MNGVIMINYESNNFPFVRLEKKFFPKEGTLEDTGNIFTGRSLRTEVPPQLPSFLLNLFRPLLKTNFVPKGVKDSTIGRAECLIPLISSKLSAQEQISDLFFGLWNILKSRGINSRNEDLFYIRKFSRESNCLKI